MKTFKVTVKAESGSISYEIQRKTERGAIGLGKKIAKEAFFGEDAEILIEAL